MDQSDRMADLLTKGFFDFRNPTGDDLVARCEPMAAWVDGSRALGVFPFVRSHVSAPDVRSEVVDFGGHRYAGVNLGSQDYLGLARHPAVMEAAARATLAHGTHSAGSEPMGGGFGEAGQLQADLAEFLGFPHVVLFPTGWGAGYGAIKGLIRPTDYVLIDSLAHDCLQHGARASTQHLVPFKHNDVADLERCFEQVRSAHDGAVLVVTESLFSMDSDHPDFVRLLEVTRAFRGHLLVDVAHDLGVLGPGGRGVLAEQGVLDSVDFLMGSFSKTFACLGGFVATRTRGTSYYVRSFSGSYTFSNFLMPAQVAAARTALQIVRSDEGDALRDSALEHSRVLRDALTRGGLPVGGRVSSIVLPLIGPEPVARVAQRRCFEQGLILNSIEFPACRRGEARFRMQVTPRHDAAMLETAAATVVDAVGWARDEVSRLG